ncbi:amidase [Streptosporangium sp. 'caverna']|uniref:amidase n=1 Tax=Streptosporangium sp. 'caverna' TaxID=2202249 RepID=UPI00195514A6|nr:amidase [Streptosporangium sp. 'caverna']
MRADERAQLPRYSPIFPSTLSLHTKGHDMRPDPHLPTSDEFWRWSATHLARAIRAKEVSAREVLDSCVKRIGEVNPRINALVDLSFDEAVEAARVADDMVAAGMSLGPLHGVPTSLKINSDQEGFATSNGVVAFADAIATDDSPQARLLRSAGGIFVGRSNAPTFSYRWFTENDLFGRTSNPWDSTRTPGGSSGGAGAAVASGMIPIAQGNDIGGSIRYPAYACGVVGLRPTVGRVPGRMVPPDVDDSLSMQLMAVQGPLARTVEDVRLALTAMSSFDPRDPLSLHTVPSPSPARRPRRVGVLRRNGVSTNIQAVDDAVDSAAGWLAAAGYEVEEIELPLLEEAYRLWYLLCMQDFRPMLPLVGQVGDVGLQRIVEHCYTVAEQWWGAEPTLDECLAGWARRGTLISQLQRFLEDYPIVLMPTSAEQAFEWDRDIVTPESMCDLAAIQYSMMAVPVLGFPALSVPTGVADGLPAGVQLLARRFDESALLDAGALIEANAGVLTPVDPH